MERERVRDLDKETREIVANDLMKASDFRMWEAGHRTKRAAWVCDLCLLEGETFFIYHDPGEGSAYLVIETPPFYSSDDDDDEV